MSALTRSLLPALLALATTTLPTPATAQTAPLHSLGEAALVARAQGYTGVGNLERRGQSIWATATDTQGNRVRLELDRRTGAIVGVNVVEASIPSRSPLPSVVPPAPPVVPPGVEPKSYYVPPQQPLPHALGSPRIGVPGPAWCGQSPLGPGC